MEPNLLVGDRLFVTKYSYGYSKHSFPFSPPFFTGRIFSSKPSRGDVIVFKTPADNRTDYIKRLIGLPGDTIQFIDGDVYINDNQILKTIIIKNDQVSCGNKKMSVSTFEEKLINGKKYLSSYRKDFSFKNSDLFTVPANHYFFLGDNRDCSKDSRFLTSVGYVHENNLVGKAQFIFFSLENSRFLEIWKWPKAIRFDRIFEIIK